MQQWNEVGRRVIAGEHPFYILAPVSKRVNVTIAPGLEDGECRVYGFKAIPVFGCEQTHGAPVPKPNEELENWISALPLRQVAESWGLTIRTYTGSETAPLGSYTRGRVISLGTKNLSTWAHELVHAADDRLGQLKEKGQHWRSEAVAEIRGAVFSTWLPTRRNSSSNFSECVLR
jgi:hypothetical protein